MKHAPLAFALLACADAATPRDLPPRDACAIAVIHSDYSSTAVSLLTADGQLCAPDIVTSGSRPPGLLTALSGDVVLPSEAAPDGIIYLIDRHPNAVITTVDPRTDDVLTQRRASVDFAGNPQDIAFTPAPLTARLNRIGSEGSDLAWLESDATIDLDAYADDGLWARPTRFARATGLLWVGLTHMSDDYLVAGPGRALGLDPASLEVRQVLELAPFENCGNIAAPSADAGLWVVCSGLFAGSTTGPQIDFSGLAYFAAPSETDTTTPTWTKRAADIDGRPLGFTIAPLDERRAIVVSLGDPAPPTRPDRLVLVDRDGPITVIAESTEAFELGAVLPLPSQQLILVADGNRERPRIRRFTWPTDSEPARELDAIIASDTGLPPRHIAPFRP